jgi:hypothetical protein
VGKWCCGVGLEMSSFVMRDQLGFVFERERERETESNV